MLTFTWVVAHEAGVPAVQGRKTCSSLTDPRGSRSDNVSAFSGDGVRTLLVTSC